MEHEKKHKHKHKHSHHKKHKHSRHHHHKSHKHKHKSKRKDKGDDEILTTKETSPNVKQIESVNDGTLVKLSLDETEIEDALIHQALLPSNAAAITLSPPLSSSSSSNDDNKSNTDAATGQQANENKNDSSLLMDTTDKGENKSEQNHEDTSVKSKETKKSKKSSRRKPRSKSRSTSRQRRRSRSTSKSRDRRKSRSTSKSHSRRKIRSSSQQRRRRKSRSMSPYNRRSYRKRSRGRSTSPHRTRSTSHHRTYNKRRSRSRSTSRRNYNRRNRRRSRSTSRHRSYRRRSRSRHRSYSRSSSSSRLSAPPKEEEEEEVNPFVTYPAIVAKTKADIIAEFTSFCRDLTDDNKAMNLNVEQYHPFQLAEEKTTAQPSTVTPTQVLVDINAGIDTRPIEMRYPVSSGLHHQKEGTDEQSTQTTPSMSVADIISERALIQQRLLINPADAESALLLQQLDTKMSQWCQVQTIPGLYTGCKEVTPMDKSVHKEGLQAWAKKKMFYGLRPVKAGYGMRLMMKMGWKQGEPLGKSRQGFIEPIPVDVKTDRQGLSTEEDKTATIPPNALPASENTPGCLTGKHPVSALQELCSKKQWDPPAYDIVSETGPIHMKTYLYKVTVNNETYQPTCGTNNKKMAKAQAALSCLKGLGLLSNK